MPNIIADLLVKLGLDVKGVEAASKKAGKSTKDLSKGLGILKVGAMAAGAAVVGAIAFGIREYAKAQAVVARLASLLKNMNGATAETVQSFVDMGNALQNKTGFGNDDITSAMTDMVQITGDYNIVLENAATITDFAAGGNMDLATSAMLLGRAYKGDTTMLKRYGVTLKEGVKGMEALHAIQAQFAGSGAARLNTLQGQWDLLKNNVSDNAKLLGQMFAPVFIDVMKKVNSALTTLQNNGTWKFLKSWLYSYVYRDLPYLLTVLKNIPNLISGKTSIQILKNEVMADYNSKLEEIEIQAKTAGVNMGNALNMDDVLTENAKKLEAYKQEMVTIGSAVAAVAGDVVTALTDHQATLNEKMVGLLKIGLNAVLDVIGYQIQAYMALEAAKAVTTGGLSAGTIAGVAVQLAAVQGFKAAVNSISLAEGGIAYGPVNAVVGDNPVSPEVVAPLHKLEPMIAHAVNNSMSNNMKFIINNYGLDNMQDLVRMKLAPELERYFKRRGGAFYGA